MKYLLLTVLTVLFIGCGGSDAPPAAHRVTVKAPVKIDYKAPIELVLRLDANIDDHAEAKDRVEKMRSIDLSKCPEDFRLAFVKHIHAWDACTLLNYEIAEYLKKANSTGTLVGSFLRGIAGDPLGTFRELSEEQKNLLGRFDGINKDIQSTFHEVELIATKYNAKLIKNPRQ